MPCQQSWLSGFVLQNQAEPDESVQGVENLQNKIRRLEAELQKSSELKENHGKVRTPVCCFLVFMGVLSFLQWHNHRRKALCFSVMIALCGPFLQRRQRFI